MISLRLAGSCDFRHFHSSVSCLGHAPSSRKRLKSRRWRQPRSENRNTLSAFGEAVSLAKLFDLLPRLFPSSVSSLQP